MNDTTAYRDPMTEQEINDFVDYILSEMDEDTVLSEEALSYIDNQDTVPNEADQETIMNLLEEKYHASQEGQDKVQSEDSGEEAGSDAATAVEAEACDPVPADA